jgi:N utilization substance protein A
MVESTPEDFGRVAAQTAKQVILQRLREAEREAQYAEFIEREGDMVHGTVHSISPQAVTVGLLARAEAILPRNQQIPGERFRVRDRIRVYVLEVRKSSRGPVIVVSRTHPNMLRRLLEMEVPEISQGLVEIKAIAREAGKRAKVAVAALREGVDPVGACVGLRGVRIQSVVRDLNDEKIDVIEWNPEANAFIAKALSPARVSGVYLDDNPLRGKTAMVVVPEDQLSLAIGRAGVNARLAAKLTGWRIDIKSLLEAAADSIALASEDPELAGLLESEAEAIEGIEATLEKKTENRPVTPEEYQAMKDFVDKVQGHVMARRQAARDAERALREEIRAGIPEMAYQTSLEDVGLSTRVFNLLTEGGYHTAGEVMEQVQADKDSILSLSGFGPKSLDEVETVLTAFPYPEPEPKVVEPEEPEVVELAEPVEAEAVEVDAEAEPVPAEPEPVGAEAVEAEAALEVIEEVAEALETEPDAEREAELEPDAEAPLDIEEAFEAATKQFEQALRIQADPELEEDDEELDELEKERARRKRRVVEYDPDSGEMIVKRRRKRETDEWEEFDL